MGWQDRVQEAAYTAPDGYRIIFDYVDVQQSFDKKVEAFEFPDVDGTYVQQTGNTGRRIPMLIIFWGDDYDLQAETFFGYMQQTGIGKLEHPVYGTVDVVPFGAIVREDRLTTAANQAVFRVTFWETVRIIYPIAQNDPASDVVSAIQEFNSAVGEEFEEFTSLDNAVERTTFRNEYSDTLASAKDTLQNVAATVKSVEKIFNTAFQSIDNTLDILVGEPLDLAFQTSLVLQIPSQSTALILDKLSAYRSLAGSIIGTVQSPSFDARPVNKFYNDNLFATLAVTGAVLSTVNNTFQTKTEALSAAVEVLNQFDDVNSWREESYTSLGEIDSGASYQQLQEAVALTAGFLVQISFSLKQERVITLDRDRNMVELVAELYGTVDSELDFFIQSNDLSGNEIVEIPKGRQIVYFV